MKYARHIKLQNGKTGFIMLEACQCGQARGPLHGVCGNCGNAIEHKDAQRDAKWDEFQEKLRGGQKDAQNSSQSNSSRTAPKIG